MQEFDAAKLLPLILSDDKLAARRAPTRAEESNLEAIAAAFASFDGFTLERDQKGQRKFSGAT